MSTERGQEMGNQDAVMSWMSREKSVPKSRRGQQEENAAESK